MTLRATSGGRRPFVEQIIPVGSTLFVNNDMADAAIAAGRRSRLTHHKMVSKRTMARPPTIDEMLEWLNRIVLMHIGEPFGCDSVMLQAANDRTDGMLPFSPGTARDARDVEV